MINTDVKLLEALQESTCFGIAHDETVPECKQCDVRLQCKARTEGAMVPTPKAKATASKSATPVKKESTAPKKPTIKPDKPDKPKPAPKVQSKTDTKPKATSKPLPVGDLPAFKDMTTQQLVDLATERNVEWKDYGNENITRMRLIMALKKSY